MCCSESLHYVIEVHDAGQGVPDMKVVIAGQWDPDKDKFNKKLGRVKRWQKFSPVFRQERYGWKEKLVSMKAALNRQEVAGLKSDYWKKPVDHYGRITREGEAEHGGLQDSAPLGRAVHGEHREHVPLCRANRAEQVEQAPLGRPFFQNITKEIGLGRAKVLELKILMISFAMTDLIEYMAVTRCLVGVIMKIVMGTNNNMDEMAVIPGEKTGPRKVPTGGASNLQPELPKLPEQGQRTVRWMPRIGWWRLDPSSQISQQGLEDGGQLRWTAQWMSIRWLAADPLTRLRLQPPQPVRDPSLGNPQIIERLEQRVTTILLPALPIELRRDLVANRQLWPGAVIFRVLRTYQPGGWGEKASVLQELTNPTSAETPSEASSKLRMWRRQKARAEELKATLPDVMLQVQALETIVQKVIASHQQVSFRIATFRMYHKLDINPSQTSLMEFLELLTAEMDSLVNLSSSSLVDAPTATSTSSNPRTKALTTSPNATRDKVDLVCRFWGTNNGCHHAKNCRFNTRSWKTSTNRCWHCSATTHQRAECPYYGHPGSTPQDGGSEAGGLGKSKDGKRGEGKSKKGNKSNIKGGKPNATSNKCSRRKRKRKWNNQWWRQQRKRWWRKTRLQQWQKNKCLGQQKEILQLNNNQRLERHRIPQLLWKRSWPVTSITENRSHHSSILNSKDGAWRWKRKLECWSIGGATHCLRTCVDEKEWSKAGEIRVMLAEGGKRQCGKWPRRKRW